MMGVVLLPGGCRRGAVGVRGAAWWSLLVAGALGGLVACRDAVAPVVPFVAVEGDGQRGEVGLELAAPLVARVVDGRSRPVAGVRVVWVVDSGGGVIDPPVVATDGAGRAVARWTLGPRAGRQVARAVAEGYGSVRFSAEALPGPVVSVTLAPESVRAYVEDTVALRLSLQDRYGNPVVDVPVAWASADTAVVVVGPEGRLVAVGVGRTRVTASVAGHTRGATVVVVGWRVLSAGVAHSCGVTTEDVAYCWGGQGHGELGDPAVDSSRVPHPVAGGLRFRSVSAGDRHTCGVTRDGEAYCWGDNGAGQLGDGTTVSSAVPVRVAGGHLFVAVEAAGDHTCGLAADGAAYCWGRGDSGQLGQGRRVGSAVPVRVVDVPPLASLGADGDRGCALSAEGAAYCWGALYESGTLGGGWAVFAIHPRPAAVAGGNGFVALAADRFHACGLRAGGSVLCWGDNTFGQLGDGSTAGSATPVLVAGGPPFTAVSAGAFHTCGLTAAGAAYCWGFNAWGELGSRAAPQRCTAQRLKCSLTPILVAGAHAFASLAAGYTHTCGVTTRGAAYCWGFNRFGQLGSGAETVHEPEPVRVRSPSGRSAAR